MVQATFLESCTCVIVIWWEYVNCEIEMTSKLFFNLSRTVFVERMMHPRRPRGRIVGARESLNGWKNKAQKKSKERPEEALGTMSYQTSSKRSPPFWLLIGARKTQLLAPIRRHCPQGLFWPFFTFLCALFFHPFRLSLAPTICPWVSKDENDALLQIVMVNSGTHLMKNCDSQCRTNESQLKKKKYLGL